MGFAGLKFHAHKDLEDYVFQNRPPLDHTFVINFRNASISKNIWCLQNVVEIKLFLLVKQLHFEYFEVFLGFLTVYQDLVKYFLSKVEKLTVFKTSYICFHDVLAEETSIIQT